MVPLTFFFVFAMFQHSCNCYSTCPGIGSRNRNKNQKKLISQRNGLSKEGLLKLLLLQKCRALYSPLVSPTSQATIMPQSLLWFSFYSEILILQSWCWNTWGCSVCALWLPHARWTIMKVWLNWPLFETCNIYHSDFLSGLNDCIPSPYWHVWTGYPLNILNDRGLNSYTSLLICLDRKLWIRGGVVEEVPPVL